MKLLTGHLKLKNKVNYDSLVSEFLFCGGFEQYTAVQTSREYEQKWAESQEYG